ncbi:MAG: hypothetical protein IJ692_02110 [Alloprevotella sp.]|nr:hypothetical protein [Alloprevotella sp.]
MKTFGNTLLTLLLAVPACAALAQGSEDFPRLSTPHRQTSDAQERTLSLDVQANINYSATCDAEWATVISRDGGIYVHLDENPDYQGRETEIRFSSEDGHLTETLLLKQEGRRDGLVSHFLAAIAAYQPSGYAGSEPLDASLIAEKRDSVWQAWRQANNLYDEEKLISLARLAQNTQGAWTLPASLESNAVMNYRYGSKGTAPAAGYPLFIYLHGSGDRNDEWTTGLSLALGWNDSPSVYFIPQIPNTGEWYRWWQKSKQWAWEKLLRQALASGDINPDRIYVLGISEGGYGSQRLASFYGDYWAAAGPMAGGEPLKNAPAENLRNTPFSLRTGSLDDGFFRNTLTTYTKTALDSLQTLHPEGYEHWVTLIEGSGHGIDYSPTTPWMKKYTRNATPMSVSWEDYEMDGLNRHGFANLEVLERPTIAYRTYYEETISDNVVNVTVQNVDYSTTETREGIEMKFERTCWNVRYGKFRIYLNEDMVDLSRPVRILVNGREYFNDVLQPDVRYMVNSTSCFFDPRRVFPVAVDVDIES